MDAPVTQIWHEEFIPAATYGMVLHQIIAGCSQLLYQVHRKSLLGKLDRLYQFFHSAAKVLVRNELFKAHGQHRPECAAGVQAHMNTAQGCRGNMTADSIPAW